jgi:hypothetical protein
MTVLLVTLALILYATGTVGAGRILWSLEPGYQRKPPNFITVLLAIFWPAIFPLAGWWTLRDFSR